MLFHSFKFIYKNVFWYNFEKENSEIFYDRNESDS